MSKGRPRPLSSYQSQIPTVCRKYQTDQQSGEHNQPNDELEDNMPDQKTGFRGQVYGPYGVWHDMHGGSRAGSEGCMLQTGNID